MTRSSLVFTVDRLNASLLGPYGGTWASTPNFNRLAAQSVVIENALTDSPDLGRVFRSYWQGMHACVPQERATARSVIESLTDAQIRTVLVTDEPLVAAHPLAEFFTERMLLPTLAGDACADDVEETQLAQSLAAALDILADLRAPFLLWIHLRGMAAPWDAPLELRESLRGEDDPESRADAKVPSLLLPADYDPDVLLGITQAYAAQMMLLDMGLGVLLAAIDSHPARDELLLVLTSPRGFPLGEHLRIGDMDAALYGELLHVPLLLRRGDGMGAMARDHALVQPADIAETLVDWFNLPRATPSAQAASLLLLMLPAPPPWPREQTLSIAPNQRATRTLAWFLRQSSSLAGGSQPNTSSAAIELFSKPDDRFEANEVSSRCPLIVEQLATATAAYERALIANDVNLLTPLAQELSAGLG